MKVPSQMAVMSIWSKSHTDLQFPICSMKDQTISINFRGIPPFLQVLGSILLSSKSLARKQCFSLKMVAKMGFRGLSKEWQFPMKATEQSIMYFILSTGSLAKAAALR